jgi:ABC-2 type transport system permease protein
MNPKRIAVLLVKELWLGPKNFIFIWAIVAPVLISLVLSLVFGTFLSEKPRLGITDEGDSQLVALVQELESMVTKEYDTTDEMRQAVAEGAADMGIVLPLGFDAAISRGEIVTVSTYIWGESLAKHRVTLPVTISSLVRELAGQEVPIDIDAITLGDEVSIPWSDRLMPLVVLMAIVLGGIMLPATSLINEKQKRTLEALVITPTTVWDIFIAKGMVGVILSMVSGFIILLLNQAFGVQPGLLVMVLLLGAAMAVEIGLVFGALVKNITTLFTIFKMGGILLYAPAFIYLFPQIPEWVGQIFPTYYLIQPIVDISQQGGGWSDIAANVFILAGIDVLLAGVVLLVTRKALKT